MKWLRIKFMKNYGFKMPVFRIENAKNFKYPSYHQIFNKNYNLFEVIQSKYFLIIIIFLIIINFNLINYFYCSRFNYTLPSIEIISLLRNSDRLPSNSYDISTNKTFYYNNGFLIDILRDIYIREESNYLQNILNTTIIVQPKIFWTPYSISLKLTEGYYNFDTKEIFFSNLSVSTLITKPLAKSGNHFDFSSPQNSITDRHSQEFIRQFIYTLFNMTTMNPISYNVDYLLKPFYLKRIGHFGILLTSIIAIFSLLPFGIVKSHNKISLYASTIVFLIAGIGMCIFSSFNTTVSLIVDINFPNFKNHLLIFVYLLQTTIYLSTLWFFWIEFEDKEKDRKEKELISAFTPSPEPNMSITSSSCYSNSAVEVNSNNSENYDEAITSSLSLDPHSRKNYEKNHSSSLHSNHYDGPIQVPRTANTTTFELLKPSKVERNYAAPVVYNESKTVFGYDDGNRMTDY